MAKRQWFTLDEVLDDVLSDDEDYDPDEPMMEGSDDDFSDLEMDERNYDDFNDPVDFSNPATLSNNPTLSTSPTHGGIPGHNTPSSPVSLSSQQCSNSTSPSSSGTSLH